MSRRTPRSRVVSTRFTHDEYDALTQVAQRLGIDLSELIRRGSLALTYPPPPAASQTTLTLSAPLVRVDWGNA
jgi:hypothetical protein